MDLKSGRLSHEKNGDGSYAIDASDLRRIYPDAFDETGAPIVQKNTDTVLKSTSETGDLRLEVERLRERLKVIEQSNERERQLLLDQVSDLRRRADADSEERRKLTAILTDQRAQPLTPSQPQASPLAGLFGRLLGSSGKNRSAP